MASYKIEWKSSASRELRSLPKDVLAEIVARVTSLSEDPFPPGVKKLAGAEHTYRIRFSSYRVIYTVEKDNCFIEIVKVGHRPECLQALTIAAPADDHFEMILKTWEVTNFSHLKPGDAVNLEADVIAKYVERLLQRA